MNFRAISKNCNGPLPLIGNVLKPLAKSILIPLGLTAAAATDAAIHKKMFWPGITILIILNNEMNYIMKIVKSLEGFGLSIKGVSKTIKSKRTQRQISWYVIRYIRC